MTWSVYVNHERGGTNDPVVAATWCGHVVNLEGSSGPWKVVQALREQSGMSIPIRAALWIQTVPTTPSPSRSSTRTGESHSRHDPPTPRARQNTLQDSQRRTPTKRSPHPPHSYTVCVTSALRRWSALRTLVRSSEGS